MRFRRGAERARLLPAGQVADGLDEAGLAGRLARLGAAGGRARVLDEAVEAAMARDTEPFSELSAGLAESYLQRIGRPLRQLGFEAGAYLTTRGYVAHRLVEAAPAAYGAVDVPVVGTFPPARDGRPPADLLTRVVKATRRGFEHVRAIDAPTWEGFVAATTWRAHVRDGETGAEGYVDPRVVEGLVRFGWILRQADLAYGAADPS